MRLDDRDRREDERLYEAWLERSHPDRPPRGHLPPRRHRPRPRPLHIPHPLRTLRRPARRHRIRSLAEDAAWLIFDH